MKCFLEFHDTPNTVLFTGKKFMTNEPQHTRNGAYCSNERILFLSFCIQSRIGFQLMPKLDEVILKLTESGILEKWMILQVHDMGLLNTNSSRVTNIKINEKRTFNKIHGETDELVSLGIAHVGGAFLMLLIGYIFAFVTFVIEILLFRYTSST